MFFKQKWCDYKTADDKENIDTDKSACEKSEVGMKKDNRNNG